MEREPTTVLFIYVSICVSCVVAINHGSPSFSFPILHGAEGTHSRTVLGISALAHRPLVSSQANSLGLTGGNGSCGLRHKARATIVDLTPSIGRNPAVPTLIDPRR